MFSRCTWQAGSGSKDARSRPAVSSSGSLPLRHLFDWLVTGEAVPANPAASVRGPRHVVCSRKTSVLEPAEARRLLDSIDAKTPAGVRDRALVSLMVYSFARSGAALGMNVEDVFNQNRKLWVRLLEKVARITPCPATTILNRL
jgi:site-specific recombinase XerC